MLATVLLLSPVPYYFYLQSLTLPLQGFFNAIVYGWTQEEFVDAVGSKDAPDDHEGAALIKNFPLEIEESINNQEDYLSPVGGFDTTLTVSRSIAHRETTLSGSQRNKTDDMTDYYETDLSGTDGESSIEATVSVHKV